MEKKVSTLLFDLGGVILNLNYDLTIEAFNQISTGDFETLYTQAKQNETFDLLETGELSDDKFYAYMRSFLGVEATDDLIKDAWNAMLLDLPKERIDLLMALKTKYNLLLFSNTNAIHYNKFRETVANQHGSPDLLEQIFNTTYYSHILGKRKPHGTSFQFILDEQNLKPEEVIFIDDTIQHIEGAASIGIQTRHLHGMDIIECCKDLL